jgi:hypothetical protein
MWNTRCHVSQNSFKKQNNQFLSKTFKTFFRFFLSNADETDGRRTQTKPRSRPKSAGKEARVVAGLFHPHLRTRESENERVFSKVTGRIVEVVADSFKS